jgi:hypothetical protein
MPQLHILFDRSNRLTGLDAQTLERLEVKQAVISVADNLTSVDIYNLASKLAGMLLEQLDRE